MVVVCVLIFGLLLSSEALIMPLSKKDGSLDMSSLESHISLLEQTLEEKASHSDISNLEQSISKLEQTVTQQESELQTARLDQKVTQSKLDTALDELKDLSNVKTELAVLQSQIQSGNSQCTCGSSGNTGGQPAQDMSGLLADVSTLKSEVDELKSHTKQTDVSLLSADVSTLKSEVDELKSHTKQTDVSVLSADVSTLKSEVTQLQSLTKQTDVSRLSSDVSTIKTEIFQIQSLHNRTATSQGTQQGGSVYTRWGRTLCPPGNNLVYKGYTAGSYYSDKGGSAAILCLPEHPIYSNNTFGIHATSQIWGTEYASDYTDIPFHPLAHEDMPCAVCESNKSTSIMVPARNACYQGWTPEYSGYLMGGLVGQTPADYICVDTDAEAIPGGHDTKYGNMMYPVESKCGPLVCPPYVDGNTVTCAVCSK